MIAEDDRLTRELFANLLEEKGFHVVAQARDGKEALEVFKNLEDKPDLVIIDYTMPKKNGYEVIEKIMESHSDIRLILISGDVSNAQRAVMGKNIPFLAKPVEISKILSQISIIS